MASEHTIDKINAALFILDDLLVSPEVAAAMFGVKKRFFNRLVAANSFNLQECRFEGFEHGERKTCKYYREDIERISKIYKVQRKQRKAK